MDFTALFSYGDMVRDDYSGFTGKVVAVCFYKTGCTQYCVHPGKLKEDGTILNGAWLDETRLQPVEPVVIHNQDQLKESTNVSGGPQRNAPAAD